MKMTACQRLNEAVPVKKINKRGQTQPGLFESMKTCIGMGNLCSSKIHVNLNNSKIQCSCSRCCTAVLSSGRCGWENTLR